MSAEPKQRLGRGLAALIGDDVSEESVVQDARHLRHLPIETLKANPNNPRKVFADEDLEDLARSIRQKGLLQPLVVRSAPGGSGYEIVAGERRWRAAQRAGIHDVPVLIRDLSDGEALEVALIENVQRADLNPLEESRGYQQLINQFGHTQQQLADAVGKSRSHIANSLRLLNLPDSVQEQIEAGLLTAGHARTLVASESPGELAQRIIKLGMSVREAERMQREAQNKKSDTGKAEPDTSSSPARPEKPADITALENRLAEATGLKIEIADSGKGSGQVIVSYQTLEQLDDVCARLNRRP